MSGATTTAPGRLELVRAFVNTRDVDEATDALGDPESLSSWLRANGLLEPQDTTSVGERERERAVAVREALRDLLLGNNDGRAADPATVATLNEAAARAGLEMRLDGAAQARLVAAAPGVDGALGRLLLIAYEAMESGEWMRLKACRNDTCQWGFYDHSKNHSRTWCSMEGCGSQAKSRAYRARKRTRGDA